MTEPTTGSPDKRLDSGYPEFYHYRVLWAIVERMQAGDSWQLTAEDFGADPDLVLAFYRGAKGPRVRRARISTDPLTPEQIAFGQKVAKEHGLV